METTFAAQRAQTRRETWDEMTPTLEQEHEWSVQLDNRLNDLSMNQNECARALQFIRGVVQQLGFDVSQMQRPTVVVSSLAGAAPVATSSTVACSPLPQVLQLQPVGLL